MEGDLSAQMVAGIDKFLMREITKSVTLRKQYWKRDASSPEAWEKSLEPNRARLRKMLGVVDERLPVTSLEYVGDTSTPADVAESAMFSVSSVKWQVLKGVYGEGLLLQPKGPIKAYVVASSFS